MRVEGEWKYQSYLASDENLNSDDQISVKNPKFLDI